MANEYNEQIRIVQETVAGKEINICTCNGRSCADHLPEAQPNPQLDYGSSAIGIMNMTPPESAVIASDILQ